VRIAMVSEHASPLVAPGGREAGRQGQTPRIVHAHFWMSGMASRAACQEVGIPLVPTFHALGSGKRRHQGEEDPSPAIRIAAERTLLAQADAVIATCTDEVRELDALGGRAARISVIPCGVDLRTFTPDGPAVPRSSYRHRLVCLGRLVARKGVDTVIAALRRLPDAELLVAGGPPPSQLIHDPAARRLWATAERHGVADRVHLLGRLDRPRIPRVIRSADVLVSVPVYEPFGIVPVEAMACGGPVVVSAVGGMLDTVQDGVNGLKVPPDDAAATAGAVRSLPSDPERRARMGAAARAARRYSWSAIAARTLAVYDALLAPDRFRQDAIAYAGPGRAAG